VFDDAVKMMKSLDSRRRPIGAFHVENAVAHCDLHRSGR
jgi:hypothetical protein